MTDADQEETMELELRFFATFRAAVGQKTVNWEVDEGANIGDVLWAIEDEYPELVGELLDDEGDIKPQLTVLKNGREVVHLEGTETELDDGDRVSVFPPVAGG
ncbi:MAG: ubiquitin-like small modifier protein 1 [Natronomonas sp.]